MADNIDGSCMVVFDTTVDPHSIVYCTRPAGHDGPHHSELKQHTWED